jgi:hypothetical protein
MTYWAVVYYAGYVVFSMGFTGQTLDQCHDLSKIIITDINNSYDDQTLTSTISTSMFPTNKFSVQCEDTFKQPDNKYQE